MTEPNYEVIAFARWLEEFPKSTLERFHAYLERFNFTPEGYLDQLAKWKAEAAAAPEFVVETEPPDPKKDPLGFIKFAKGVYMSLPDGYTTWEQFHKDFETAERYYDPAKDPELQEEKALEG